MTEDLEKRVEQAAQGTTPQTKPDERRHFLGSLRERTYLRMDNIESQDPKLTRLFLQNIDDFKNYTVLINAHIPNKDFLGQIEGECSKRDIPFTLVNNETALRGPHDTAVLVVNPTTAINRMRIEISQVYAPELPKEKLPAAPTKKGFWHRLFHGEK